MGDGWSIAWRVLDAQFWGVPQRRRRIALIADFGGCTAPEILFERKSVRGYTPPRETPWKEFAAALAERFGTADKGRTNTIDAVVFNGENITSKENRSNPKIGNPCHTLNATGSNRCYCIQGNAAAFNQGENAQYDFEVSENGVNSTLTAKGPSAVCESTVRRLTPLECERLQGFPDGWTDIGDYIDTKGKKRKTSDTARYKALGNSIALPPWAWLLERLSRYCEGDYTMASLFDGIGGFPLIWEALNGEGTCLWASEIDEFPIAVTKRHFS